MDRRSWIWPRKSSEKSPGESESSGSVSSHSERFSDDQEPSSASPKHGRQSPEISSSPSTGVPNECMKDLTAKLQAALLNIKAKEDLVRQHAKVAEEAVTGWEKAEKDASTLRKQLEAAFQKNSTLEELVGHLDVALKECLEQLRQAREEQEQKVQYAVAKRADEFETSKSALETKIFELQSKLESTEKAYAPVDVDLKHKLETLERENSAVKQKLHTLLKELEVRTLERDLSTQAAESASKQHLESVKKMAKLDAQCRQLRAMVQKTSTFAIEHKSVSSLCVESLSDSQSDSGELFNQIVSEIQKTSIGEWSECEASWSDSRASALISKLDQFKNEKANHKYMMANCVEIDLLDDFLVMEKLVALPETEDGSLEFDKKSVVEQPQTQNNIGLTSELVSMVGRIAKLEQDLAREVHEKEIMETTLSEIKVDLERPKLKLIEAEEKMVKLQSEVNLANDSKLAAEAKANRDDEKKIELETQLEKADIELHALGARIRSLEVEIDERKALALKFEDKCKYFKADLEKERELSSEIGTRCKDLEMEVQQLSASLAEIREMNEKLETQNAQIKFLCREMESRRANLEVILEQERASSTEIKDKKKSLEMEINQERASFAQAKARCQTLEEEISIRNQESLKHQSFSSNGELKYKQEKEFAVAARKLAQCQRTIASLGRQLKSLASVEDLLFDP